MTRVHITTRSTNKKTGHIPVSTTEASTCPPTCPFNSGGGCYAASGPLALHWRKVSSGERGDGWGVFCDAIAALPEGQLWRHNQAGDLPGDGRQIDGSALGRLVDSNRGRRGFTFTHYPVEGDGYEAAYNGTWVSYANQNGFTVNLSANSPAHADRLAALDIGPVATVLPGEMEIRKDETMQEYRQRIGDVRTPQGRRISVCPATYRDTVSCATCGLCARAGRGRAIVGFPAHGTGRRKASAMVEASQAIEEAVA